MQIRHTRWGLVGLLLLLIPTTSTHTLLSHTHKGCLFLSSREVIWRRSGSGACRFTLEMMLWLQREFCPIFPGQLRCCCFRAGLSGLTRPRKNAAALKKWKYNAFLLRKLRSPQYPKTSVRKSGPSPSWQPCFWVGGGKEKCGMCVQWWAEFETPPLLSSHDTGSRGCGVLSY